MMQGFCSYILCRVCCLILLFGWSEAGTAWAQRMPEADSVVEKSIEAYCQWSHDYVQAHQAVQQLTQSTERVARYWGQIIQAALDLRQGRSEQALAAFEALDTIELDRLQRYALVTERLDAYQLLGQTELFFEIHAQWQIMTRRIMNSSLRTTSFALAEYVYAKGLAALYRYYVEVGNVTLALKQLDKLSHLSPQVRLHLDVPYERQRLYLNGKNKTARLAHFDAAQQALAHAIKQGDAQAQITLLLDIANWLHDNGETDIVGHRQAQLQLALTPKMQRTLTEAKQHSWQYLTLQYALGRVHQQKDLAHLINGYLALAKYHTQSYAFDTAMHYLQEARSLLPQMPIREAERNLYEHASIVAAALGDKSLSDKFRNAYLDLLNVTRLDKTQEAILREQQNELNTIKLTTTLAIVAAVVFVLLCVLISWLWLRSKHHRELVIKYVLEDCERAALGLAPLHANSSKHLRYHDLHDVYNIIEQHLVCRQATDENDQQQRDAIAEAQALANHQIVQNKAINVELRAKMLLGTGTIVYVDRLLHLLKHTPADLDYGQQLVQRILKLNQHLISWVQVKTGRVNIKIETLDVHDVLSIVTKAAPALQMQGITLHIKAPDALKIKADKALTLFMINTLVDNARKYTPAGGSITIAVSACAQQCNETVPLVEVSVSDTGVGIEAKRLEALLVGKPAYKQHQRGGFGLMNCRGIMERYRKVSQLFAHCRLTGESVVGKGTRFAFTLPRGMMVWLATIMLSVTTAIAQTTPRTAHIAEPRIVTLPQDKQTTDSVSDHDVQADSLHAMFTVHPLWARAKQFVDAVYQANVQLDFAQTLRYADSALYYINAYVATQPQYQVLPQAMRQMQRYDSVGSALTTAEIIWHAVGVRADYRLFLDLRNELAVAYLGLGFLDPYTYNNEVYLHLYRSLTQKPTTQMQISEAIHQTRGLHIVLMLIVVIALVVVAIIYVRTLHDHVVSDGYMRQRLKTSLALLGGGTLTERIAHLKPHLAELTPLRALGVVVLDDMGNPIYTFGKSPKLNTYEVQHVQNKALASSVLYQRRRIAVWPIADLANPKRNIGHITLLLHQVYLAPHVICYLTDTLRFVSSMVYAAVVNAQQIQANIDLLQDKLLLTQHDSQQLYVQNALIENTLSVLKHETMYFPSRLSQLLTNAVSLPLNEQAEKLHILQSMAQHYRELCQVLLLQATQQFSLNAYRWQYVSTAILCDVLAHQIAHHNKLRNTNIVLQHQGHVDGKIYVEPHLIELMTRQLWQTLCPHLQPNTIIACHQWLSDDTRFLVSALSIPISLRQAYPIVDELDCDLFAPEAGIIPLLLCKNIVRIHDRRTFHAGYRIAISEADGHTTITTAWLIQASSTPIATLHV